MMRVSMKLSEEIFQVKTEGEMDDWLRAVEKETGGLEWVPLGGIPNNVHTVQVSADPALALVERPINSIDAVLDLKAEELKQTAPSPHEAAAAWWGVPAGGLSEMKEDARRELADLIRVTNLDSGNIERPTIVVHDAGTGQHPDDFSKTLLSLLESNKKSKSHQMGVYNAGGAASYAFCPYTVIISRKAPQLLAGKADELGVAVVRYNPLDPDKYKSGTYEYCVAKDKTVLRLDLPSIPDPHSGLHSPGYGTYVKHISYELSKYHRGAHEPKRSLWHLFHAAIPDPPLPFRIIETRTDRFPGMKGAVERRVIMGLLHLLRRPSTAEYHDEREISLGPENGKVIARYFVLNAETDPDAYTTSDQGVTITLNGQRQGTKDRYWVKRNTDLHYIYRRLVILVDGNKLTNAAKRDVFASTRESHKDSPLTRKILERMLEEMREDEDLRALDEQARERFRSEATRSTSEKVKRQLASQVAAFLQGQGAGTKGGKHTTKTSQPRKPPKPRNTDDTAMLDIPDTLQILTDPLVIHPGARAALRLAINAKNGFLPKHAAALTVVLGPEVKDKVKVLSTGRLLGGRVRIALIAADDTPLCKSTIQVALVDPALPVLLTAAGNLEVVKQEEEKDEKDTHRGGEPDVEILWHKRVEWENFDPVWDDETVGKCHITRDQHDKKTIVRVEWHLNEAFQPYEAVISGKKFGEAATKTFQESYELPVCWGMFQQSLAEYEKEKEADEEGRPIEIPDDYVKGELTRIARAVLIAKEADVLVAQAVEV
jgi:hypothetical protein